MMHGHWNVTFLQFPADHCFKWDCCEKLHFIPDGEPLNFTLSVCAWLGNHFPGNWI